VTRVDLLLMHIDRVLAECDARRMPPLTSEPAAAVLDLSEQAGLKVDPWQASVVRAMYADPIRGITAYEATGGELAAFVKPLPADPSVWPEPVAAPERPASRWRRWWSW
jgi:hypothetical protein